jgi:hypothetical protein
VNLLIVNTLITFASSCASALELKLAISDFSTLAVGRCRIDMCGAKQERHLDGFVIHTLEGAAYIYGELP